MWIVSSPQTLLVGCKMVQNSCRKLSAGSSGSQTQNDHYDPALLQLGTYPKELKTGIRVKTCK